MRPVVGFLSYATAADRDTDASISTLRDVLERAVRAHGAAGFELFQDRVSIRWGDDWERTLTGALDDALFFLPVLTPQFFASDWCRREAEAFLARRARDPLTQILPVYLVNDLRLEDPAMLAEDPLRQRLRAIQYVDLRPHRLGGWDQREARVVIDTLAERIAHSAERIRFADEMCAAAERILTARGGDGLGDAAARLEGTRSDELATEVRRLRRAAEAWGGGRWDEVLTVATEGGERRLERGWAVIREEAERRVGGGVTGAGDGRAPGDREGEQVLGGEVAGGVREDRGGGRARGGAKARGGTKRGDRADTAEGRGGEAEGAGPTTSGGRRFVTTVLLPALGGTLLLTGGGTLWKWYEDANAPVYEINPDIGEAPAIGPETVIGVPEVTRSQLAALEATAGLCGRFLRPEFLVPGFQTVSCRSGETDVLVLRSTDRTCEAVYAPLRASWTETPVSALQRSFVREGLALETTCLATLGTDGVTITLSLQSR